MLRGLTSDNPGHHLGGALAARNRLPDMGFHPPEWDALANGLRPEGFPDFENVGPRHHGWQREATQEANNFFLNTAVWPRLSSAARTLFRSQGSPLAGLPFSCCPTSPHIHLEPQVFRVLLFRRLSLPLPPTRRNLEGAVWIGAGWKVQFGKCSVEGAAATDLGPDRLRPVFFRLRPRPT